MHAYVLVEAISGGKKISNATDETRTIFINLINERSADYLGDTNKRIES